MKDLPKVFQNKIDHNLDNDQRTYTSFNNYKKDKDSISINDIDNILNDRHHIMKLNVKITTDNDVINCKIISRTNNYVLTMDNKKIPINSIRNIEVI